MTGTSLLKAGRYVTGDVVAVVISMMGRSTFPANTQRIHTSFSRVRWLFPVLQRTMVFSRQQAFPFSRELEGAFDDLLLSRVLTMSGDFGEYVLTGNGKGFIEEYLRPLFSEQELEELGEIAAAFTEQQPL